MATRAESKQSLVDIAEEALRSWLATGRHRAGERLPPEQELSAHLGISRGTLRTALQRLEDTGEIVRRQGSGTYVGRAASTALEVGPEIGELFEVEPDTKATHFTRVLILDGEAGAWMRDIVHPDVELPSAARLRKMLESGDMFLPRSLDLHVMRWLEDMPTVPAIGRGR